MSADELPESDAIVSLIAGILYKRMGLGNDTIAFYTSWLLLPWSLKPLWSPLLEMYKTKKFFVVLLEFVGGLSLALIAMGSLVIAALLLLFFALRRKIFRLGESPQRTRT